MHFWIIQFTRIAQDKALDQFIYLHNQLKDRERDQLRWGDEIEYILVRFDHAKKKVANWSMPWVNRTILRRASHCVPRNSCRNWVPGRQWTMWLATRIAHCGGLNSHRTWLRALRAFLTEAIHSFPWQFPSPSRPTRILPRCRTEHVLPPSGIESPLGRQWIADVHQLPSAWCARFHGSAHAKTGWEQQTVGQRLLQRGNDQQVPSSVSSTLNELGNYQIRLPHSQHHWTPWRRQNGRKCADIQRQVHSNPIYCAFCSKNFI